MTTLAVVSDTHLSADPVSASALRHALARIEAGTRPDALLLPGDLTADGDPAAYRLLRETLDPVAARLGVPVVTVMGNHDEGGAFRAALGAPESTTRVGGLRVIALDSTVPGHHHGLLGPARLAALAAELDTPAPAGTVLVLHHPPLPSAVPSVDLLRLRDADRLAEVVAGSDVRMIVSGHAHHAGAGALAGIPVWIAPALVYQVDVFPPAGRLRGVAGAGISRIDLIDGATVASAVPLDGDPVYDVDAAERIAWMRARIPG
ncbi:metallophosphoesterase [Pseudonocardia sp. ICBG601]|uniref:metallophosphoesterase n=1 Tax=Pseudonocardia sp. ICBG601 TaxID=2846759 RepID=UPI001CF649F3|nr:metallophosphoesterase [Pseudonocardia sp. ICBG601]